MERKILDINLQHDINTFLYESLPLCVILAKPELYEWFLNHFVDLYLIDAIKNMYHTFHNIRYIEVQMHMRYNRLQEVLIYNQLESRVINNKVNIVDFVKANIDDGSYLMVFLNEWAIPHKSTYHNRHWYHESLVYGYDDEQGVVYCISFNENQVFTSFEVDYHSFWDGFQLICNDPSDISEYQRYTYLLKPREIDYSFDIVKFAHQLENYLNDTTDLIDKYNFDLFDFPTECEDWNYTFGAKIFDRWSNILQTMQGKESLSYLEFHIVAEHKKLMLKRLEYIYEKHLKIEDMAEFIENYRLVVESFEKLRFLALKYNQLYESDIFDLEKLKSKIEKIVTIIKENQEQETEILMAILKLLQKTCLTEDKKINPALVDNKYIKV